MAHFAELDENNFVTKVIVIDNDKVLDENGEESEIIGIEYCKNLFVQDTQWIQTSYNNNFRKRFAGIGSRFLLQHQCFLLGLIMKNLMNGNHQFHDQKVEKIIFGCGMSLF